MLLQEGQRVGMKVEPMFHEAQVRDGVVGTLILAVLLAHQSNQLLLSTLPRGTPYYS